MNISEVNLINNSISNWLIALAILIAVSTLLILFKRFIQKKYSPSTSQVGNEIQSFMVSIITRTGRLFILALALYAASLALVLPNNIHNFLRTTIIVIVLFQLALWGISLIDFLANRRLTKDLDSDAANATSITALKLIAKIALWTIVILLILENLTGVEINSLIAGLGVTGVAVALAVQNILGDLFASLSITLDKPFVIGDNIVVDEFAGTVEKVGMKSTRVRSINGEKLIFSNSDLLNSRIRNMRDLEQRTLFFTIGVTYDTSVTKLEKIPQIMADILKKFPDTSLERAYFKTFGNSSLDFEISYTFHSPDLSRFLQLQQDVNLEIIRRFTKEGIEFAYPTQSILLEKTV